MTTTHPTPTTPARPRRAMTIKQLGDLLAAGGHVRRGTVVRSNFPEWQWQGYTAQGEYVGPVDWRAVQHWRSAIGNGFMSREDGRNN